MPRALDHLVIPAHNLAAQADVYRRLGFQVGARNRHPWGTENHIVQFDGQFLELIGLGEGFSAPDDKEGEFSFAGFIAKYLAARQGLAMLVLRTSDAEADRREFAANHIGDFSRFDFARKGRRPDGKTVDVAFSLAFAASILLLDKLFVSSGQINRTDRLKRSFRLIRLDGIPSPIRRWHFGRRRSRDYRLRLISKIWSQRSRLRDLPEYPKVFTVGSGYLCGIPESGYKIVGSLE